jgi:hypothetical protein
VAEVEVFSEVNSYNTPDIKKDKPTNNKPPVKLRARCFKEIN